MFIETKELPVTTPTRVGRYHELAESMRRGAAQTKQCQGISFIGLKGKITATCALGAAALGAGLDRVSALRAHEHFKIPEDLKDEIVVRNDVHGQTREAIAAWLHEIGGCEHD